MLCGRKQLGASFIPALTVQVLLWLSNKPPTVNAFRAQSGVFLRQRRSASTTASTSPTIFLNNNMVIQSSACFTTQTDKVGEKSASDCVTILGFGSLLSERSSRMTFPDLQNFRLGRVGSNYRRVFGHPASIFFQRGIANQDTLEMSSLSIEPVVDGNCGFVCAIFEVPNTDQKFMNDAGVPSLAFLEREEEFNIIAVPYTELEEDTSKSTGLICTSSTDESYVQRWGKERFEKHYGDYGISTIWGWSKDSGLRPCAIYLRHCYLAAQSMGDACFNSFLDDTYLCDRKTTVREYMAKYPEILELEPPESLRERYSG